MLLQRLTIAGLGPFAEPVTVQIEPDVTVLTGANDTGKSTVLAALAMFCGTRKMGEGELNNDVARNSPKAWDENPNVVCTGVITDDGSEPRFLDAVKGAVEYEITRSLAPKIGLSRATLRRTTADGQKAKSSQPLHGASWPRTIFPPSRGCGSPTGSI